MSFQTARAFSFSLAPTLMTVIVIYQAGDGTLSVMPANEYDGDDDVIVREIDPSPHDEATLRPRTRSPSRFSLPRALMICYARRCAAVVVEGVAARAILRSHHHDHFRNPP